MRKKINLTMNTYEIIELMSERNPGGLNVLMQILQADPVNGIFTCLSLDDMNIRGSMIWVAYKDFAGEKLDVLVAAIKARSQEMVTVVNREAINELAVTSGGSWR